MSTAILVLSITVAAGAQTSQPAQASEPTSGLIHRAGASPSATQPTSARSISNSTSPLRIALSLGAVLGLVVLMYWASRRMLPRHAFGGGTRAIQVLARAPLSAKHRVVLLQVGRRLLVIGEGSAAQPLNTLCEITDPDEAAALIGQIRGEQSAGGKSFASLLNSATERFRSAEAAPPPPQSADIDPLTKTQQELDGLTQRVRVLSRHFGRA